MAESKYLQVTPQYKATTFDERIKPLALYKQEYDKQQDAYDKLLEDTLMLENLKGSDVDADLYRQYSQWRGQLNSAADTLSSTGMLDMQTARDLRRQYLNEFKPMEDRYKHRNTLIATQASKASPNTIYDRDFSKIAVKDISLDDVVRSVDLSSIEKQAYEDAASRYMDTGLPDDTNPDIERLLEGIDLSGYSEDDKGRVTDSIRKGYYKAGVNIYDYLKQRERAIKQEEYQDIQMKLARKRLEGGDEGDGTSGYDHTKKDPSQIAQIHRTISGNAGDSIDVYKHTDKDGKSYYYIFDGKNPKIIDSRLINESGDIKYSDFYKAVYGESPATYYDGKEYTVAGGKVEEPKYMRNYTENAKSVLKSKEDIRKFLEDNPNYSSDLMEIAKEKYGVKDLLNSNISNFKDIYVTTYSSKSQGVPGRITVKLLEKSRNGGSFNLSKTEKELLEEKAKAEEAAKAAAEEGKKDEEGSKASDKDGKPAGKPDGVGNTVLK